MARARGRKPERERGSIDELPSGALRVRVYAGLDPVSKKRHDLTEIIPAEMPDAWKVAERVRNRFLAEVDERRNPKTNATVSQLLRRYLDQFDGAPKTLNLYRGYVRNHIDPLLGKEKVGSLDADILESFYAECRRCQDHCNGKRRIDHRTSREHECDHRCGPHECKPLGATTIRHMHFILSGAYRKALRWRWVSVSPIPQAEPPEAPPPNPQPPTPEQAARIVNEAWRDPSWGAFIWTAMTTGARRGEMCALRWSDLDLSEDRAMVWIRRGITKDENDKWCEAPTKTHQQRRVALDPETTMVLSEHRQRRQMRAAELGIELADDAFVFSSLPDGARFYAPSSITQRYEHLAERLHIDTTLHKLRHYSATELILAGVDIRTVGGRLGHGSGGATTLRVYAAFVSEADQRAAGTLSGRMPVRPVLVDQAERAKTDPQAPYERIAAKVREDIVAGTLPEGAPAPSEKQLAADHGVSLGTAHRAMDLVKRWGLIESCRGQRAVVLRPPAEPEPAVAVIPQQSTAKPTGRRLLDLEVVHLGHVIRAVRAEADPNSPGDLRRLLVGAIRRNGHTESELDQYEMNVRNADDLNLITTFVAL